MVGLLIAVLCFLAQVFLVQRGYTLQSAVTTVSKKAEFIPVNDREIRIEDNLAKSADDVLIDDIL